MITLRDLLILTDTEIVHRSHFVDVWTIRSATTYNGRIVRTCDQRARTREPNKITRVVSWKLYGNNKNILDDQVWVHCSCQYFTYNLEFAMSVQGSSSIVNARPDYPFVRNPDIKPHLCKHAVRCVQFLKQASFPAQENNQFSNLTEFEKFLKKSRR